MIKRAIVIVLDSFGAGETPDAKEYGDEGSNTLRHIYERTNFNAPNMKNMGLFNIDNVGISDKVKETIGAYGKAEELSKGKNSPVGHWEMSGHVTEKAFYTYPNGFPEEMINEFINETGLNGILCNKKGSGTELLKQYGEEHLKTGYPIIYTSADSVFQIAAHENIIPVEKLYEICEIARKIGAKEEFNVGTVIARPFVGDNKDNFTRTYNRRDFESQSFGKTMLEVISEAGKEVIGVGKILDLFSMRGITKGEHTQGNIDGLNKTLEYIKQDFDGLLFTNLVDFDMLYGHRNNVEGYAKALEEFDAFLPKILDSMKSTDMLIITADHGCDPTMPGTDHTREHIPILIYGEQIKNNVNIGTRKSFADISATILEILGLQPLKYGKSFKGDIFA